MLSQPFLAMTWARASASAASAVSITSVEQGTSPLRAARTSSTSIDQLVGRGSLATGSRAVPPSTSMKTGSGIWAASVDLPMPSGP